jgi:ribosomal protein S18 acetylase RimI-like enzyme
MDSPSTAVEGLVVLPASLRDLRQVMRLERACFEDDAWPVLDVISALVWPGGVRLKAVVDRRMIGLAIAEPSWSDAISMITSIGVDPAYRRRGVGSVLLAHCESMLQDEKIRLTVRADNQPAIRMYERFGYAYLTKVPNYYRDGQAGLVMEKIVGRKGSCGGGPRSSDAPAE